MVDPLNRSAAECGDVEGVHQMRVVLRRLRATLVLFGPRLEPHAAARSGVELRRLGRVLGEARDWDVFCEGTLPAALAGEEAGWRVLLEPVATAEREAAHRRLRAELAGPALTSLTLGLAAWAEEDPIIVGDEGLHGMLADLAPALLDRLSRKVARRGRHLRHHSGPELHALRKSLKKLRYSADHLGDLFPRGAVKAYLKRCKVAQELLGEINDAATAVALTEHLSEQGGLDLAPALGTVAHWAETRRQEALRRLPEAWHAFRNTPAFWRSGCWTACQQRPTQRPGNATDRATARLMGISDVRRP